MAKCEPKVIVVTRVLRKRPDRRSSVSSEDGPPAQKRRRTGRAKPFKTGLPTSEPSTLREEPPVAPNGTFNFMKLPAELRIHIYRMALFQHEPLLLHHRRTTVPEEISSPSPSDISWISTASDSPVAGSNDPINVALLRANSQIYKEARQVLYADNTFVLSLTSGISTLASLHQRSRSLIKNVTLTIPSHHDILDGFADLVRLGLRYCWGLKRFTIVLELMFPGDDRSTSIRAGACAASTVYANAFHILRWLPRACKVVLEGNVSEIVRKVVAEEGRLLESLDEESYLKRQHQMAGRS
ncbi:hypothetical protein CC80DRAFT_496447 [Byssothecium circinans]|uniref:DUF7730 domain-containing protein n=1 Tax=Byssothecium circinans TaxID=147558 RepID=A0A6A5TJE2_9PLEO|nr:hypothetical protein CC80DRAFT_496447 [Byssothecium circinans]